MGLYTRLTRDWLERRFSRQADGSYAAHQPIFGATHARSGLAGQLPCVLRILRILDGVEFGSFLDVGGAEGYVAWLVRRLYGADVTSCDLSVQACRRARELFDVPAAAIDGARLPFADGAFDVVLCSEVIEHVEHPVEVLLELRRVAARAVVLTTEELHHDRAAIDDYLFRRPGWPHMERNRLHPDDLRAAFGEQVQLWPQADRLPERRVADAAALRALLQDGSTRDDLGADTFGVAALWLREPRWQRPARRDRRELVDFLLAATIAETPPPAPGPVPPALLARLRCPRTGSPLRADGGRLVAADGTAYPVSDGVPDLFPGDGAEPTRTALAARLQVAFPHEPARQQALLALRDRLHLPDAFPNDRFDFADAAQQRGFWANEQLVPRAAPGPGFHWTATGADPWLSTPCLQRRVRRVTARLRVHNPAYPVDAPVAQLFWQAPDEATVGEDRCLTVPVRNDGAFHDVVFDLAAHPRAPTTVGWLRLDPADGPCEVDLQWLRLE